MSLSRNYSSVQESFLRACQNCDLKTVETLLQGSHLTNEIINAKDDHKGYTGLMNIVGFPKYDLQIVKLLLNHPGIETNVISKNGGNTALMIATVFGRREIIKCLLDHNDICIDMVNYEGETAVDMAKKEGKYFILQLFKDRKRRIGMTSKATIKDYKEDYFHSITFGGRDNSKAALLNASFSHGALHHLFQFYPGAKQAIQKQRSDQAPFKMGPISSLNEKHITLERKLRCLQLRFEQIDSEKDNEANKQRKQINELAKKLNRLKRRMCFNRNHGMARIRFFLQDHTDLDRNGNKEKYRKQLDTLTCTLDIIISQIEEKKLSN